MQIQLPKLRKIDLDRPKKKKIFLIADDVKFSSGIATIAKEIVLGTCDKYDWCQLAAAINHPDHGKRIDLSQEVDKETGKSGSYVMQYGHNGYGSQDVIREIIMYEKPDVILLITDPRFFGHVFTMEHELRSQYKIPLAYLNVWDNGPVSYWNSSAYASIDLLMSINRQTKVINQECLKQHRDSFIDIDIVDEVLDKSILLSYVPHGSSTKYYFKQSPESRDWNEYSKFKEEFLKANDIDFLVLFNNRNVRRKQPGDVILAFKRFCDKLPKEKAKKCALFMKTAIQDENGTDLMAVKHAICPDYKVIFNQELLSPQVLNWLYNLADGTFYMSSAEGFGLAANESLLCGTMLVAPVTGGLQDQMRFQDESGKWITIDKDFLSNHKGRYQKCGEWALPIFPKARVLQGSIPTPYIFDDFSDADDASEQLFKLYEFGKEERDRRGELGRQWVLGEESGMSSSRMCEKFIRSMDTLFNSWKPKERYEFIKINPRKKIENIGISW